MKTGAGKLLLFFIIPLLSAITDSCRVKDPDRPRPVVKVIVPSTDTVTVDSNSVVDFKFEVTSDTILYKWVITYYKINEDSNEVISPITFDSKDTTKKKFKLTDNDTINFEIDTVYSQIIGSYTRKVHSNIFRGSFSTDSIIESGSVFKVNLYAVDDGDLGSSAFFYVKVVKNYMKTPMADFTTKKFPLRIHNLAGGDTNCNPGYDFVKDTLRYSTSGTNDIDMINTTLNNPADTINHAVFAHGWESKNGTQFVLADSTLDFETATLEKTIVAFNKGTKKTKIGFSDLEYIYVIKLRNTEEYLLMKITDVYDDYIFKPDKDGNYYDCDYLGFRYRKKK